jgi:hypothetical protein
MEEKRPNQCVVDGCNLNRYGGHSQCILHCEKKISRNFDVSTFKQSLEDSLDSNLSCLDVKELNFTSIIFPQGITINDLSFLLDLHQAISIRWNKCHFTFMFSVSNSSVFSECTFDHVLDIEQANVSVSFYNCVFNNEFKAENIFLDKLFIRDCVFNKLFLIFDTSVIFFAVLNSTFKSPVEVCASTLGCDHTIPYINNVTFDSVLSFQDSKFPFGIDFDCCIIKDSPNFRNIEISSKLSTNSTPRETFRLIKHSFDSIGNTIEANKYYALEMDKLYSELTWKNNFSEKLLLSINKYTSNFGQNWWLPIVWMLGFSSLFYALRQYDPFDFPFLNGIASFIIPYQGIIGTTHQMSKLLTSILFGVLIYQTTVALKRKTRR